MGDPCVPKTLSWDGLSCSYAISSPPRIKSVHLSFSGLNIDVSFYFAKLKALEYLDLSHNKLEGSIPYVLSQLPSLMVMNGASYSRKKKEKSWTTMEMQRLSRHLAQSSDQ